MPLLKCLPWLFGLLSWSLLTPLAAEPVKDLYVAQVPVQGQGSEARSEAIRQALAQVIVKVSGSRQATGGPQLKKLLARSSRYVEQYRYRLAEGRVGVDKGASGRLLWVKFDERAVNRLLRSQGLVVWGRVRPSLLLWIGLEEGGHRRLMQPELEPALRSALQRTARQRGVPVLLPLMDLQDRNGLKVSDLWGGFEQEIRRASRRYQPDVILAGHLRQVGRGDWRGDWTLLQPGADRVWSTRGPGKSAAAVAGLQRAVDELAAQYAPRTGNQESLRLRLRISGMRNLADYILVKDYLHSLGMIERLDLLAAEGDHVSFLAQVRDGREPLKRDIMLGGVLEVVKAQDQHPVAGAPTEVEQLEGESLELRLR